MTFQIIVQPSGHRFECEADETVLGAAIRAGVGLPYGCKNGACGSCKGKVVEGAVTHRAHQQRALSEQEAAEGFSPAGVKTCGRPIPDLPAVTGNLIRVRNIRTGT